LQKYKIGFDVIQLEVSLELHWSAFQINWSPRND
jgi:hypothetical protein